MKYMLHKIEPRDNPSRRKCGKVKKNQSTYRVNLMLEEIKLNSRNKKCWLTQNIKTPSNNRTF